MLGHDFPLSEYYRDNIVDATTLSRAGSWWTALVVIRDPRGDQNFLSIYRWEMRNGQWKKRASISFRTQRSVTALSKELGALARHLPE